MSLFSDTSVIPYAYWTKKTARGENTGRGLEAGSDYFVLKSHSGNYFSENSGGHCKHKDTTKKEIKWTYEDLGEDDGKLAIKNYNKEYLRCDGSKMYVDRDEV